MYNKTAAKQTTPIEALLSKVITPEDLKCSLGLHNTLNCVETIATRLGVSQSTTNLSKYSVPSKGIPQTVKVIAKKEDDEHITIFFDELEDDTNRKLYLSMSIAMLVHLKGLKNFVLTEAEDIELLHFAEKLEQITA